MKIKVEEIGWGICKDENENFYVGIENGICQNMKPVKFTKFQREMKR